MKKRTVKIVTYAMAAVFAVAGMGMTAKASYGVLDDEQISITAALDEYLAEQANANAAGSVTDVVATDAASTEATTEATTEVTTEEASTEATTEVSTAKYPEFEGKALANVSGNLNIRVDASAEAERIGMLPAGAVATVLETKNDWTKISSGSVTGYVKSEYLVFGDDAGAYAEANLPRMAIINTETLKVREEQSTESACVTMIPGGEEYAIIKQYDEWTEIEIDETMTGYVKNEYINISFSMATAIDLEELEEEEEEEQQEQNNDNDNDSSNDDKKDKKDKDKKDDKPSDKKPATATRKAVVNYALQFVGNPYKWGGTSLTNGADCSGFTLAVYKHFGISLPHSSSAQSGCGKKVSIKNLQKGDLIFYGRNGRIGHVAIYIGNGKIVHASSRRTGIKISKYNYKTPICARSLLD